MNVELLLPYAFALVIAIPFILLIRQFVYKFIEYKAKEVGLLALKSNNEIKLQALERMVLFLERIKPANLVKRFDKELTASEFIYLTEKNIAEEFEYNASQQLYISQNSWSNIVNAKNDVIKLLHSSNDKLGNSIDLQEYKTIFLMNYLNDADYIAETIDDLRKETNRLI